MASSNGRSVLIINPNTTQAMTDALKPLVHSLGYETVGCILISLTGFRSNRTTQ